ncbi:Zinc finger protein 598 [Thelohanellus kitauei]|uniref:Zinc finger protein 598 n=1 Tax=Thelohanellus kitauei TaxID=669202 RepID=A0A0C2NBM0_THEKT|nr:Zinc finger protein 598 [Thelohanellus kitauei]
MSSEPFVCQICYEESSVLALSACNHPICCECMLNIQTFKHQNNCPICRLPLHKIVIDQHPSKKYKEYDLDNLHLFKVPFYATSQKIVELLEDIVSYRCRECGQAFNDKQHLIQHLETHDLYLCELCIDNLYTFPKYYIYYTKTQLLLHKRDPSSRHVRCDVCYEFQFNQETANAHRKTKHVRCPICENLYLKDHEYLRFHALGSHYLCEACPITSDNIIFRTESQLIDHRVLKHFDNLTRSDFKFIEKSKLKSIEDGGLKSKIAEMTNEPQHLIVDETSFPPLTTNAGNTSLPVKKPVYSCPEPKTYETEFPALDGRNEPPSLQRKTNEKDPRSIWNCDNLLSKSDLPKQKHKTKVAAPVPRQMDYDSEFPVLSSQDMKKDSIRSLQTKSAGQINNASDSTAWSNGQKKKSKNKTDINAQPADIKASKETSHKNHPIQTPSIPSDKNTKNQKNKLPKNHIKQSAKNGTKVGAKTMPSSAPEGHSKHSVKDTMKKHPISIEDNYDNQFPSLPIDVARVPKDNDKKICWNYEEQTTYDCSASISSQKKPLNDRKDQRGGVKTLKERNIDVEREFPSLPCKKLLPTKISHDSEWENPPNQMGIKKEPLLQDKKPEIRKNKNRSKKAEINIKDDSEFPSIEGIKLSDETSLPPSEYDTHEIADCSEVSDESRNEASHKSQDSSNNLMEKISRFCRYNKDKIDKFMIICGDYYQKRIPGDQLIVKGQEIIGKKNMAIMVSDFINSLSGELREELVRSYEHSIK